MSLYEFFPMKKRKVCKTPTTNRRGTCTSTLGKLKKRSDSFAANAGENRVEILWDNNSPSPTTSLALATKRRRKQPTTIAEDTPLTDVSFVVQKLSENTSPVVDHGHPALLEVWINKADQKKNIDLCDEEFTSPPFPQNTSPFSTPLVQRRTTKRKSRKASKQFMLEIRKLVDEIQKNDLSSSSSQSQKEISTRIAEDQAQTKRAKNEESSKKVTLGDQSLTSDRQASNNKLPNCSGPGTSISGLNATIADRLMDDSFDWTEDDMDELILTCQLSSSGHGSLTVPDAPKPKFGSSPSQVTFVPETQVTQMKSQEICTKSQMKAETKPCTECTQVLFSAKQPDNDKREKVVMNSDQIADHAQEVPQQNGVDVWDMNFDEDDALLASAVEEFELSQEAMAKIRDSPKKERKCPGNNDGFSFVPPETCLSQNNNPKPGISKVVKIPSTQKNSNKGNETKYNDLPASKTRTRQENQNYTKSNSGCSFKQPLRTSLPTAINSSQFTKINCFSKKLDENPLKTCPSQNSNSTPGMSKIPPTQTNSNKGNGPRKLNRNSSNNPGHNGKMSDVNSKAPTTQTKGLTEKVNQMNCSKGPLEISSGNIATSRKNLSLMRSTPNEKKVFESTNENRFPRNKVRTQAHANGGFSSPLQSTPGNASYPGKHASRAKTKNLEKSKETCLKALPQTKADENSNQKKKDSLQNNKGQENEFDFLLCEENFSALFEDFNFDDVLAEAATQASTKTTSSLTSKSAPELIALTQKKCSKDEIERKRMEAQRRLLAKAKQRSTTQSSNPRISKR